MLKIKLFIQSAFFLFFFFFLSYLGSVFKLPHHHYVVKLGTYNFAPEDCRKCLIIMAASSYQIKCCFHRGMVGGLVRKGVKLLFLSEVKNHRFYKHQFGMTGENRAFVYCLGVQQLTLSFSLAF